MHNIFIKLTFRKKSNTLCIILHVANSLFLLIKFFEVFSRLRKENVLATKKDILFVVYNARVITKVYRTSLLFLDSMSIKIFLIFTAIYLPSNIV